ncbi:MAG: Rieske 2Fe-2S domain-containing protein, partial [Acidimicrobiaceae bacterium]|nr:Rieske 2Fe-2S domain-containing protein [Acidimicrobiaceae bacterium]
AAIMPRGRARSVVSGTWLGHPAHPFLVTMPIGCWTGASLLDLAGQRRAARLMIGAGIVSTLPVAVTGASDWVDTAGAERQVGLVHAAANAAATTTYALSWWARRRDRQMLGFSLALAGAALASVGGWLGGHLAYSLGVGVDTNAFQAGPQSWTLLDLRRDEVTSRPSRTEVDGVALIVAADRGRLCVLADRCSHRGGPLSEGALRDGVVTCPWHGSRFDIATGEVVEGPAVVAQPVYDVRSEDGRIAVRRFEPRALRTNVT